MKIILVLAWISVALTAYAKAQETVSTNELAAKERFHRSIFTTPAYRREASRLIIEEANRLAQELSLPEQLPIIKSNLVELHIASPYYAKDFNSIGTVTTSNYYYRVFSGSGGFMGGFTVGRTRMEQQYAGLEAENRWPWSQLDTNAAYQLAAQWMTAVAMDLKGLNRDCRLTIEPWTPEGTNANVFVPLYRVRWYLKGKHTHLDYEGNRNDYPNTAAETDLFLPTKMLCKLEVDDPTYILRKPVVITNVAYLLSQTNEMVEEANRQKEEAKRIRASQKESFEQMMSSNVLLRGAVQAMVAEANRIAEALPLPEQLPITATNLAQIHVESPKTADDKEVAGSVVTSDYKYDFSATNGFGVYRMSADHLPYDKYHCSLNQINTNAAYQLATQWLAAVSIDVKGLNRDYKLSVVPEHVTPEPGHESFPDYYWPFYRVTWYRGSPSAVQMGAHVQMFLPTKTMRRMIVQDTKYILYKPLEITNLVFKLSKTNAPAETNVPTKP